MAHIYTHTWTFADRDKPYCCQFLSSGHFGDRPADGGGGDDNSIVYYRAPVWAIVVGPRCASTVIQPTRTVERRGTLRYGPPQGVVGYLQEVQKGENRTVRKMCPSPLACLTYLATERSSTARIGMGRR